MSLLERIKLIEGAIIDLSDNQKIFLEVLEEINGKLDRLLVKKVEKDWSLLEGVSEQPTVIEKPHRIHSPGFEDYKPPVEATTNFALPKTGKYQWYKFADQEGKVRECDNNGCDLFLKYNKDKKSYEHWKYDANTGVGGYVQDKCDYYFPEGEN